MIYKRKFQKSSRSLKVSEIIRKAISEILIKNELPIDPPFNFPINVTKVEMNSDLRIASVYVLAHDENKKSELIEKLNKCKQFLSKEVSKLISLKFSPRLVFKLDETFEKFVKLEKIFNTKK